MEYFYCCNDIVKNIKFNTCSCEGILVYFKKSEINLNKHNFYLLHQLCVSAFSFFNSDQPEVIGKPLTTFAFHPFVILRGIIKNNFCMMYKDTKSMKTLLRY
jgi:hypothetical protein